jgi:hypothetical protein
MDSGSQIFTSFREDFTGLARYRARPKLLPF